MRSKQGDGLDHKYVKGNVRHTIFYRNNFIFVWTHIIFLLWTYVYIEMDLAFQRCIMHVNLFAKIYSHAHFQSKFQKQQPNASALAHEENINIPPKKKLLWPTTSEQWQREMLYVQPFSFLVIESIHSMPKCYQNNWGPKLGTLRLPCEDALWKSKYIIEECKCTNARRVKSRTWTTNCPCGLLSK